MSQHEVVIIMEYESNEYEIKVILRAVADIIRTSKSLDEAYERINRIANVERADDSEHLAIEDIIDLRDWYISKAEFEANPVTYSHEEVMKHLGVEQMSDEEYEKALEEFLNKSPATNDNKAERNGGK